jgi:hypothetical protein
MANQVMTIAPAPQGNDAAGIVNFSSGSLTGDGGTPAAYTLPLGFVPRYAMLLCIASSVAANVGRKLEWFDGMADGAAIATTVAGGAVAGGAVSQSLSATLGPTVLGAKPLSAPLLSVTWPAGVFDPSATYVWQCQG